MRWVGVHWNENRATRPANGDQQNVTRERRGNRRGRRAPPRSPQPPLMEHGWLPRPTRGPAATHLTPSSPDRSPAESSLATALRWRWHGASDRHLRAGDRQPATVVDRFAQCVAHIGRLLTGEGAELPEPGRCAVGAIAWINPYNDQKLSSMSQQMAD